MYALRYISSIAMVLVNFPLEFDVYDRYQADHTDGRNAIVKSTIMVFGAAPAIRMKNYNERLKKGSTSN